jgi:vacuolar-type H+-ATPase subunit I/STV1
MSETSTWMHVLQTIDQLRETALTTLRELEAENAALRDNIIRQLEQKCRELEAEKAVLHSELCTWRARAYALAGPLQ